MPRAREFSSGRKGGDDEYKTQDVGGVREEKGVVLGIVKVNSHPAHMGNLSVFIPSFADKATEATNKAQWRTVKYATPFYSRSDAQGSGNSFINVKNTAGMVYPCPDVGSTVLCFFPEGKNQDGFWFACAPDIYMMQGLPESGSSANLDVPPGTLRGNTKLAPALEFNDNVNDTAKPGLNFTKPIRAFDSNTHGILKFQGLDFDTTRGLSTSNYMRESPSEIFGITTKGRKVDDKGIDIKDRKDIVDALKAGQDLTSQQANAVEGRVARKHGHTFVMDDGTLDGESNLVRLRSAGGHQILLHDTKDLIYIANSKGTAWIEIDPDGSVDVYSQNSINMRSKNINFHADASIKMHAKQQIQLVSEGSVHVEGKAATNIYSDGMTMIYGGKGLMEKTDSVFAMSGNKVTMKGSAIDLQAGCISLNGSAGDAGKPTAVTLVDKDDTVLNPTTRFWETSSKTKTTVGKLPTHEPFKEHAAPALISGASGESTSNTEEDDEFADDNMPAAIDRENLPISGSVTPAKPKQTVSTPSDGLKELFENAAA